MLKLSIPDPERGLSQAVVPITWCIDQEASDQIQMLGAPYVYVLLVVLHPESRTEQRSLVKLTQMMDFLYFRRAGAHEVYGCIVAAYDRKNLQKLRELALSKEDGKYKTHLFDAACPEAGIDWFQMRYRLSGEHSDELPEIIVGAEFFAKEPSALAKAWANFVHRTPPVDECRHAQWFLWGFLLNPPVFILRGVLYSLKTAVYFLWAVVGLLLGVRGIRWREVFTGILGETPIIWGPGVWRTRTSKGSRFNPFYANSKGYPRPAVLRTLIPLWWIIAWLLLSMGAGVLSDTIDFRRPLLEEGYAVGTWLWPVYFGWVALVATFFSVRAAIMSRYPLLQFLGYAAMAMMILLPLSYMVPQIELPHLSGEQAHSLAGTVLWFLVGALAFLLCWWKRAKISTWFQPLKQRAQRVYQGAGVAMKQVQYRRKQQQQAEAAEVFSALTCSGSPEPIKYEQVPKKNRTFSLVLSHMKSETCRPFQVK